MAVDFSKIKAFTFDVDGVFTDGGILCDLAGELYRTYDAKDGFAVRMAVMNGYRVGIFTGGRSGSIKARFVTSGLRMEDIYLGSRKKTDDFHHFCTKYGLLPEEVLYAGDDIPDIPVMLECGVGACPSDAVKEVLGYADYISPFPGGKCAVRDIIETVMKAQGRWNFDTDVYKERF